MIKIPIQKLQKIPRLLLAVFFVLLLLNIVVIAIVQITGHVSVYGFIPMFDITFENNLPTCFSTFNLLLCSLLIYIIYRYRKNSYPNENKYWLSLSIGFFLLSVDECASVHELLVRPTQELFHRTEGVFEFAWVIPGIVICIVLALFYLKFFLSLSPRYKLLFGISALLYISGGIGMEMIDSLYHSHDALGRHPLIYSILATIEESLEMLGTILFIYSLLRYIKEEIKTVTIEIS